MLIDRAQVESIFIEQHRKIEESIGGYTRVIDSKTCPLRDLPGFDSLLVPVVFRRVAVAVGLSLPPGYRVPNVYIDSTTKRCCIISEIVDLFLHHTSAKAA